MKLGTSSPLQHKGPKDWAQKHKSLGLEAINFHLTGQDDPTLIQTYIDEAKEHGLTIAEVGIWKNTMDPDKKARHEAMDYAISQLALADQIGAKCCVNILGSKGPRWDGAYKDNFTKETWKQGVQMIQEIIDAVNPKNTFFTIESMPWMVPTGPEEYLQLLEDVGRDRFAVHMDIFNWMTTPKRYFFNEEFIDHTFELLGKQVKSCHLKDVKMEENYTVFFRETYPGNGNVNIRHLIETAVKYDPDMPFIIEHLDSDEAYLSSVSYVQNLMK